MYFVAGVSALFSGWLSDRLIGSGAKPAQRVRRTFVLTGLVMAAFVGGAGLSEDVTVIYLFTLVASAGLGVVASNLWSLLQASAPPEAAAAWGGIQGFSRNVAGVGMTWTAALGVAGPAATLIATPVCLVAALGARSLLRVNDSPSAKISKATAG
jgi:hypothetical protein